MFSLGGILAFLTGVAAYVVGRRRREDQTMRMGGAPAGALASGDAETINFGGSVTEASVNPCTGAAGTSHVTFTSVSHTQPTCTGEFTAWDGQNGAVGSTITSTAAFHDTLRGSDGSSIRDRGVFHAAVLADGTTAALDSFALVCG